jgi:hypothetical protein
MRNVCLSFTTCLVLLAAPRVHADPAAPLTLVPVAPGLVIGNPQQAMHKRRMQIAGASLLGVTTLLTVATATLATYTLAADLGCGLGGTCSSSTQHDLDVKQDAAIALGVTTTAVFVSGLVLMIVGRDWKKDAVYSRLSFGAAPLLAAGHADGATAGATLRF